MQSFQPQHQHSAIMQSPPKYSRPNCQRSASAVHQSIAFHLSSPSSLPNPVPTTQRITCIRMARGPGQISRVMNIMHLTTPPLPLPPPLPQATKGYMKFHADELFRTMMLGPAL